MNALITELVLLQLVLPLALVLLHAVLVPSSAVGLVLRFVGIAFLLVHLALAGVWLSPPWWTPWALLVLHLLATVLAYRRYASRSRPPARTRRVVELGIGVLATALALFLLPPALSGRVAPPGTVALVAPLEAGTYLVTSGGASESINSHLALGNRLKALPDGRRHAAWRGQNHAVDLIAIDRLGLRAHGLSPVEPARYRMYGRRVLAPCDGTVETAGDGVPDMPVPGMDREHMLGNHVILHCDGIHVVLAHLAPGTLQVSPGDEVTTGEELGRAGNTGNTAEPHLHVHVQRELPPEAPMVASRCGSRLTGAFSCAAIGLRSRECVPMKATARMRAPHVAVRPPVGHAGGSVVGRGGGRGRRRGARLCRHFRGGGGGLGGVRGVIYHHSIWSRRTTKTHRKVRRGQGGKGRRHDAADVPCSSTGTGRAALLPAVGDHSARSGDRRRFRPRNACK